MTPAWSCATGGSARQHDVRRYQHRRRQREGAGRAVRRRERALQERVDRQHHRREGHARHRLCVGCTIDNVNFHDVLVVEAGIHNECLYSQAANITINNSRFTNCATMDVFFTLGTWWGQPAYGGWTLPEQLLRRAALPERPVLPLLRRVLGLPVRLRSRRRPWQHVRVEGDGRRQFHEQRRVLQHAGLQPVGHGQGDLRVADPDARRRHARRRRPRRHSTRAPRRRRRRPPGHGLDDARRRRRSACAGTPRRTTAASSATGSTATTRWSATSTGTSYTVSGLACGTSYTIAIGRDRRGGQRVRPRRGDRDDEHGGRARRRRRRRRRPRRPPTPTADADPDADAHADADGHARPRRRRPRRPRPRRPRRRRTRSARRRRRAWRGTARRRRRSACAGTPRRDNRRRRPAIASIATGRRSPRPPTLTYTLTGLACGTSYTIGADRVRRGRQRVDPRRRPRARRATEPCSPTPTPTPTATPTRRPRPRRLRRRPRRHPEPDADGHADPDAHGDAEPDAHGHAEPDAHGRARRPRTPSPTPTATPTRRPRRRRSRHDAAEHDDHLRPRAATRSARPGAVRFTVHRERHLPVPHRRPGHDGRQLPVVHVAGRATAASPTAATRSSVRAIDTAGNVDATPATRSVHDRAAGHAASAAGLRPGAPSITSPGQLQLAALSSTVTISGTAAGRAPPSRSSTTAARRWDDGRRPPPGPGPGS